MQFPNDNQCALLLARPTNALETIVRSFLSLMEAKEGVRFNVPESNPGRFYRLFGADEMMITFELVPNPGKMELFQQVLQSSMTGMMCPDVRARLAAHQAMILINVSHGTLGSVANDPQIAAMLQQIGMPQEGASLRQFKRRLDILRLAARVACDHASPLLCHWIQSNQLVPPEILEGAGDAPDMLHIHPWLFGAPQRAGETPQVSILTFGARHFIGREIVVEPTAIPFVDVFQVILAFLRVATMDNGYIIPDGDTFGPEDRSLSYRVIWREAQDGDVPLYELLPVMSRAHDFEDARYVPAANVFDDRMPPAAVMPDGDEAKAELLNEWNAKRAMAEGIGGKFEVRSSEPVPSTEPPAPRGPTFADTGPSVSGKSLRAKLFGRKGEGNDA